LATEKLAEMPKPPTANSPAGPDRVSTGSVPPMEPAKQEALFQDYLAWQRKQGGTSDVPIASSTSSYGLSVGETSLPGFATDMTNWGKIDIYGQFIRRDPVRNGLHYPAVLAELGNPNKMRILDIGCNEGLFPRLLAALGASVVGYDAAPERIVEAQQYEQAQRLGIQYHVATPRTFSSAQAFDAAVSVMVLNYARSIEDLVASFGQIPCSWRPICLRGSQPLVFGVRGGPCRPPH
jgi:SAM-dependent methyltransferase